MEERKLKRGLKDISTLFAGEETRPAVDVPVQRVFPPEPSIQMISLVHPAMRSHAPLYEWMAEKTAGSGYSISLVSVGGKGSTLPDLSSPRFHHRRMDLSEFEKNCSRGLSPLNAPQEASLVFLDFSWKYPGAYEKTVSLLDKIVFWANADLEVLSEVYKRIKWTSSVNSRLEFLLAYDGSDEKKGSLLYEKMSDMISRRLGLDLTWLGCLPAAGGADIRSTNLEPLFSRPNSITLGEKKSLAQSLFLQA